MNNNRMSCDGIVAEFVIERYVADKLSESETVAFEEHMLLCDRCQRELTLAMAVREALSETDDSAYTTRPWAGRRNRIGVGMALAAAAAIAALLVLPTDRVSGPIAELGRVTQPPIYLGVPVRQAPARPDSVFGAAMSAYGAGNYSDAVDGLESAIAAGVDLAPAQFFRGASLLMLDDPEGAATAFEVVIASVDSLYAAEAHYYLAKALLRQGKTDRALAELRAVNDAVGEISVQARALADSVEAITEK